MCILLVDHHDASGDTGAVEQIGWQTPTKKISQIEAAIVVLGKSKDAMNCKAMVEAMQVAGLWSTPNGATPDATLYASILREINAKGKDARFRKTERGHFALAGRK